MPNLLELYLQNNKISKIENLPKNLLKLDLSYNELKSLDDLSKAYNLEWLNIDCNLIEKLDEVIGLSNLIEFYCSGNKINNIKECYKLSKLKKLEIIDLFDNDVCNNNEEIRINMINNCPNLRIFNRILIDKNEKSKTKDLFAGKLTNNILEKRLGSGNSTKNIIDLDLSGLKLKEQICLFSNENYPNLRTLNLSKNNFKSFNIFGMLPNLKELNLDFNNFVEAISKKDKIINGKGIMGLPNLEKLEMSNNQLINLNGIQYFKNLKTVILRDNNFSKIESLHHMNQLNYLDVSRNKIDNVEKVCLGELPYLQILICDDNIIKNINGLTKFESIKFLSCQNNKINDINCLDRLSCLKKLKEIILKGNPICKDYYYRENLIQLIPNLIKIDGRTIIEEERENSKINLNERKSNFNNLYFKQNNLINKVLTNQKMIRRVNHNSIGENAKSLLSLPQITSGKPNNKIIFNGLKNKTAFMKYTQRLNSNVPFKINGKKK
jgi:Leucine-rich repeat (LRR) protein